MDANKSVTATFTPELPDLIVSSFTHSPENPWTVDEITFTAVVKNIGAGPAGPSTLSIRVGGEGTPPTYAVPALNPDATFTATRIITLTRAQNYINTATADVSNQVTESDENNNSITHSVRVSLPTITVHDVSPHYIGPGQNSHTAIWDAINRAEKDKAACDEIQEAESGSGVYDMNGHSPDHIWLRPGNWVQVTSTVAATTAYIQFPYSDENDGVADIYVDGHKITSINTIMNGWWFLEIDGLPNTTHTVKVVGVGDVHVDYFGFGGTFVHPSANPASLNQGQTVILSATLTRNGIPVPGKTINFYQDSGNYIYDATDTLIASSGPTDINGAASASYVANKSGSYFVFARYAGDVTNKTVVNDTCTTMPDRVTFQVLDIIAPTATPSQNPPANTSGWNNTNVTVNWNWADNTGGSGIDPANCTVSSTSSGEGEIVLNASCKDLAGNTGSASYTIRVDKAPPTLTVTLTPAILWPPNHKMVDITATVTATDALAGIRNWVLQSVVSNEPDNGLGDGDTANDIQVAALGTADLTFQLRAERAGSGEGRVYTVTYTATDLAGNSTSVSATVSVPHDQVKK
jgi:hypothetical protein